MMTPYDEIPEEYIEEMNTAGIDTEEREKIARDHFENSCPLHGQYGLYYLEKDNMYSEMSCRICDHPKSYPKSFKIEARICGWYNNRRWHRYEFEGISNDPHFRHCQKSLKGIVERIRYRIDRMILERSLRAIESIRNILTPFPVARPIRG